nr:flagellar biosynthetic protein FliR [uncultured Treponema sp.]
MDPNPFSFLLVKAPLFFLVSVRIFAMISTTPLLSTRAVPRIAKIALAGLVAFLVMPSAYGTLLDVPGFSAEYVLFAVGEALLGVLTGFFISIIFATFSTAGQFFSYQMGFGVSEVYDALAQIENPLMGQFLNFIAVLIFLQIKGFQTLFLGGVLRSFQSINCFLFIERQELLTSFLLTNLSSLFLNAMMIAMPVMGTLFLVHVSMGLLSKAAPQMNLLSEGFPITILLTFFLLTVSLPLMADFFIRIMNNGFVAFQTLLIRAGGGGL